MTKHGLACVSLGVLLLVVLIGIAGAVAPDGKVKDVYWNGAAEGFLQSGTYVRYINMVGFMIPAATTYNFTAPLSVPVSLDGNPCSVKKVYINWVSGNPCHIRHVRVASGIDILADLAVDIPGTGSFQTITFDLNDEYKVPMGLVTEFSFSNLDPSSHAPVEIAGYGALIKHK